MDDEFKFYKHNRLLLRVLIFSTAVFLVLVYIIVRRDGSTPTETVTFNPILTPFSAVLSETELSRWYSQQAVHFSDIEADPTLREMFLNPQIQPLRQDLLKSELNKVLLATQLSGLDRVEYIKEVSFDITKLEILPRVTLGQYLKQRSGTDTKGLIDMALAEVRAGVVKVQRVHDVAPPSVYTNELTYPLFYTLQSYPSLIVTEAATIFSLLSQIDSQYALRYDAMLQDFLGQVFEAGAHFRVDIEAALSLTEYYQTLFASTADFEAALISASAEKNTRRLTFSEVERKSIAEFVHNVTPLSSSVRIVSPVNYGYEPLYKDESLQGVLRLTLSDRRLSSQEVRPYLYDIETGVLSPTELQLRPRASLRVGTSVAFLQDTAAQQVSFLTGEHAVPGKVSFMPDTGSLADSNGTKVDTKATLPSFSGKPAIIRGMSVTSEANQVLIETESNLEKTIWVNTNGDWQSFPGLAGALASYNEVLYLDPERKLKWRDLDLLTEQEVYGLRKDVSTSTQLRFISDSSLVTVWGSEVDDYSLPTATVSMYRLIEEVTGVRSLELQYELSVSGGEIADAELSPGGKFLAIIATTGIADRQPKLLIFDIKNGIINKELDLGSFSGGPLTIDAWRAQ